MDDAVESRLPRAAPRPRGVVARTVAGEVESYTNAVAGIEIEAVRAGQAVGPTRVLTAIGERFAFTACGVGVPMLSRMTLDDDKIIVAHVISAARGCRWCEIDLEPGAVVVYGPAAEHTARNLPGLDFMFAVAGRQQLEDHAAQLGIRIETPPRGEVRELARTPRTDLVGGAFTRFAGAAATGMYPSTARADDVLRAAAHALSEQGVVRRIGCSNRIDSRRVVHACIEYAESIARIPSISELCLVAYVSERRLREAFVQEYALPPSRFFRAWALNEAHRRLLHAEIDEQTVTEVATGLGFGHLGRFSSQYRDVYGENPSTTLEFCTHRPSVA